MKSGETSIPNSSEGSLLTESLQMLRFLHQSIMLASAAVLILALTPDPSSDYNAALDELIALKSLESLQQEYPSYLQHRLQSTQSDTNRFIFNVAMQTGARMPEDTVTPQPFACDCGLTGGQVGDYYAFLSGVHKLAPIELTYDEAKLTPTVDFLRRQMATQQRVPANLQFEGIEISAGGMGRSQDGTVWLDWRNLPREHKFSGDVQVVFRDTTSLTNPRFAVPLAVTYSLGTVQEEHFALDWLRSTPMGAQLTGPKSNDVFPKLRKLGFWRSLSMEKDVDTAISNVQKKLDSINTETTSFFGISVNKMLAIWAGPFVCSGIEWFFFLHLNQITVVRSLRETLQDYPWIALFPGRLSGLTAYITLVFLPPAANVPLLYRFGHARDLSTWVGLCFMISMILVGLMTFRQLRRLRDSIFLAGSPAPVPSLPGAPGPHPGVGR